MNTAITEKATDVLLNMVNITVQTMGDVVEFGKQQIPEVINQLLLWKALESFFHFLGAFIVMVLVVIIAIIAYRRFNTKKLEAMAAYDRAEPWTRLNAREERITSYTYDNIISSSNAMMAAACVVGGFIILLNGALMLEHLDWVKIWVAPKLYLIEYAAELIKSTKG